MTRGTLPHTPPRPIPKARVGAMGAAPSASLRRPAGFWLEGGDVPTHASPAAVRRWDLTLM